MQHCPTCQHINKKMDIERPELHPVPVKAPWHHLGMDLRAMVYAMQDWYCQVHEMCVIMPEVMANILQHLISLLAI